MILPLTLWFFPIPIFLNSSNLPLIPSQSKETPKHPFFISKIFFITIANFRYPWLTSSAITRGLSFFVGVSFLFHILCYGKETSCGRESINPSDPVVIVAHRVYGRYSCFHFIFMRIPEKANAKNFSTKSNRRC